MSLENTFAVDPIEAKLLASAPVITDPAEAEFWQLQAEKAPSLLRNRSAEAVAKSQNNMRHFAFGGVAIGGILGLVSGFAKPLTKWQRINAGIVGALAASGGLAIHFAQYFYANKAGKAVSKFADELQNSPELKTELANELHAGVNTGAVEHRGAMEPNGVKKAIANATHNYAMDKVGIGHMSVTFAGKPLEPSHLGARSWEEVITQQKSDTNLQSIHR
jgi:hypothetical protein